MAMLQRCVSFYDSMGPHWLASPRKAMCKRHIGHCIGALEGYPAAERYMCEVKRVAQRELGRDHDIAQIIQLGHAELVATCGRKEQALSMFQRGFQRFRETEGMKSDIVLLQQVSHRPCF